MVKPNKLLGLTYQKLSKMYYKDFFKRTFFLILTLLLIFPILGYGQKSTYHIHGEIKDQGDNNYAYLVMHTRPYQLFKAPLENKSFSFIGEITLNDKLYITGDIFIDSRDTISLQEVEAKYKSKIYFPANGSRKMIVIENVSLQIENSKEMSKAKVSSKGVLTKDVSDASTIVTNADTTLNFIKQHPDSPVSLNLIPTLIRLNAMGKDLPPFRARKPFDVNQMYLLLSDRLKATKQGEALKELLEANH